MYTRQYKCEDVKSYPKFNTNLIEISNIIIIQ